MSLMNPFTFFTLSHINSGADHPLIHSAPYLSSPHFSISTLSSCPLAREADWLAGDEKDHFNRPNKCLDPNHLCCQTLNPTFFSLTLRTFFYSKRVETDIWSTTVLYSSFRRKRGKEVLQIRSLIVTKSNATQS